MTLSPLARTTLFVDGIYQFSSPRGAYKLASISLMNHATLILEDGYPVDEPLSISSLEADYGTTILAYSLLITGTDMVLHAGSRLSLNGGGFLGDTGPGGGYLVGSQFVYQQSLLMIRNNEDLLSERITIYPCWFCGKAEIAGSVQA